MKEFEKAKQAYEETPIPRELNDRVRTGIRQGRAAYRRSHGMRWGALGTAACLAVLIAGLNLSPAFAAAAAEVPVVGGLFQVLTVRNFTEENGDRTLEVEQPSVTGSDFAEQIDREIQARVEEKLAEGEQVVADYKDAFFATGGTQEDWDQHENAVSVTYEIKSQTDTTVSFVVNSYIAITNSMEEQFYYNLDLAAGKELTLADLLGEDWVAVCNDAIRAQMEAAEDPTVFFPPEQGGFTTVDETTSFYINEAGSPVVVFPKYAVAPGYLGNVEFEIDA